MRINVYAEELTAETEVVTKTVTDDKFGTRTFYGVRVYLLSPDELHADPADDDRSAITYWIPWTRADGHDFARVAFLFHSLTERCREALDHYVAQVAVDAAVEANDAASVEPSDFASEYAEAFGS